MSTTSDIGTSLVTSLTNSNLNITNMAKVMAEAQVAGPKAILDRNVEKVTTELDALKYLQTNLNAFQTYLTDLSSPDIFAARQSSSSNENVVSVSVTDDAALASYQIESRQLAQSHTQVANKTYTSPSDTISSGTLNISVGGASTGSITVDASNNTLEGLQKTINNGDYGVTAAIINNGGSYQLMFTSKTSGAAGEVSLSGLADFDTNGLTTTAEAQDAVMVLNGLTVTNNTNNFDDVVDGVEFKLNSTSIGAPQTVSVNQDVDNVVDTISSFVEVYNQLDTILDELGKYDSSELTEEELQSEEYLYYGDLAGSSILRSVQDQIRNSMTGTIDGLDANFSSLSLIGISLNREGQLDLDTAELNNIATNNMQDLSSLLSKGGSSDDPLVNVIGGSEKTLTGSYTLDVTQLAERAQVTGGAANLATTTDYRLTGERVTDTASALVVDVGASFDLDLNGIGAQTISLTSGTYADKDAVAAEIQAQINANAAITTELAGGTIQVAYDTSQSRFEITSENGSLAMSNILNLSNQGYSAASYSGEQLIDLSAADATFNVKVDESTTSAVTVASGKYTMDELAAQMANSINGNPDVQASEAEVTVSHDGSAFSVYSNRFGSFSQLELTGFANFANAGFTADITDVGQSVDGTITTASGTLSIGAYASADDGRRVNISDFAAIAGGEAEVRGLEFEVLGGAIGNRGTITFAQGFASKIDDVINNLFEEEFGLVSQRMDSLQEKTEKYDERSKDIDARFEKLELKYRLQFSMLQSIMSNAEATRNQLTAQFSNNNNN